MNGIFLRKKFNGWLFILFLCGLFFVGLYIFLNIVDTQASNEILSFLIMGLLIILVVIPSWLLNLNAFIRIDEDSIKAKYHWFGKIDCNINEVAFALAQINTLTIQLKSGKSHTILGLENPQELCRKICQNLPFEPAKPVEELIEKAHALESNKKKGIVNVCVGSALIFINIFIAVLLTHAKELYEFGHTDWIIMVAMGVIEIATIAYTFYMALKIGQNNIPIEKLKYTVRRTIIETTLPFPRPGEYILKIFVNDNYTYRITIFGQQNKNDVYFSIQEFTSFESLSTTFISETFDDIDKLLENFEMLIDITKKYNL